MTRSDTPTPWFFELLRDADPDFEADLFRTFAHVRTAGALSVKTKALMILAVDATAGRAGGVAANAAIARDNGASEAEILEAVEVATVAGGIHALSTATHAFTDRETYLDTD